MSGATTLARWLLAAALAAPAFALSGCAHAPKASRTAKADPVPFRLGREDVIEVSVYRDADLTRTVAVRPDGRISLPIVGEIVAAGRTPEELRKDIADKLKTYVNDPTVISLIVREVNSARFFVVGEVVRAGAFPLRSEVSALQALALAGGLGEFSARDEVTVVRAATGEQITVDLDDLWAGRSSIALHPGDTLVVP